MKKILFIAAHRPGRSASQRFRFEQYIGFFEKHGYHCEYSFILSAEDDKVFYAPGKYIWKAWILFKSILKRTADVFRAKQYDIVFIQREAWMVGSAVFEKLLARSGAKIIFDFDDAIWLDPLSEASGNKNLLWLKDPSKTNIIIKIAHLVIAGNSYLQDYALQFNKNSVIIPTTLDTEQYHPLHIAKNDPAICIGWSGSHTTIAHFTHILPALYKLKEKYKDRIVFKVIGDKNFKEPVLDIQGITWTIERELAELAQFDIGIMPLPDEPWTRGKCAFKGLLYMSMGIPAVMSPVGVNTEIIESGVNGMLAGTQEDWVEKLSILIEDEQLRKKLGTAGLKTVEEKFSVHAYQDRYLHYFDSLTEKK